MSLIIGVFIGVALGIIPGGNPVISAWLSDFLPLEGRIASVITTFIVSGVKLSNPQTSGDLNGILEGSLEEEIDTKKIALERMGYFLFTFICAMPLFYLRQGLAWNNLGVFHILILGVGVILYVAPASVWRNKLLPVYLFHTIVVGIGSVAIFSLANRFEIANPVYVSAIAVFFPWNQIFRWGRKGVRTETDMSESINPVDAITSTGITYQMGGWNAPLTGYSIDVFEGDKWEGLPQHKVKRSLFVEATAEGARLGVTLFGIDQLDSRSSIVQAIREGVEIDFTEYRIAILVSVTIGCLVLYALCNSPFPDFYDQIGDTPSARFLFYGISAGTVFGSAGLSALPLLAIGIIINYFTCPRDLWAVDPSCGNRARSTLFIYPILVG